MISPGHWSQKAYDDLSSHIFHAKNQEWADTEHLLSIYYSSGRNVFGINGFDIVDIHQYMWPRDVQMFFATMDEYFICIGRDGITVIEVISDLWEEKVDIAASADWTTDFERR